MDIVMDQIMTSMETLANSPGSLSAREAARILRVSEHFLEFGPDLPSDWLDRFYVLISRAEASLIRGRREDHAGQQWVYSGSKKKQKHKKSKKYKKYKNICILIKITKSNKFCQLRILIILI